MKLQLFCISALAASLYAQNVTVVDNDQVKVLKVTQDHHKKTRLHDHKINRVMIYMQPGKQTIDYQDGKKVVLEWKAAEPKWSPASGMHIAEIVSDQKVTIVEVELKKPGVKTKTAWPALDPVKIDPKHYKVEFENDQVRVVRARIGPKETAPMHEHGLNRVVVFVTEMDFRVTDASGKVDAVKHAAGDVVLSGPAKHQEENLSGKPFEVLVVELKS
ncbi:MAG: hypothetical protein HYZ37_04895 [Candidatus Solibacter usitatus]|nr:hypothetical protein [Candidatus Solibacter usitatus]